MASSPAATTTQLVEQTIAPDDQAQRVPHQGVVAEQVQPRRPGGRGELDHVEQQREDDPGQGERARGDPPGVSP